VNPDASIAIAADMLGTTQKVPFLRVRERQPLAGLHGSVPYPDGDSAGAAEHEGEPDTLGDQPAPWWQLLRQDDEHDGRAPEQVHHPADGRLCKHRSGPE
jgi:hypothetical protein